MTRVFISFFLLAAATALHGEEPRPQKPALIDLLSRQWQFTPAESALTTLDGQAPESTFPAPAAPTLGFTARLTVDLKKFDGKTSILEISDVLSVCLREHNPLDRQRQNYPAFKLADGSVPVLEATVRLHSDEHPDWREMTVGFPLAMLDRPEGEHEVVLHFTGVRWTVYADGELLDNDFPYGYPQWPAESTWKLNPEHVKRAALYVPAIKPVVKRLPTPNVAPVQYWTPPGHNSWVGDVATLFHQGRYHVFYLYDRRHHRSKFGKGAHYFEHLSTADFRTWTEHEAATPLEAQWECIGTGTPFAFEGKLCLAYGLHTERIYPDDKTTLPAQMAYITAHGCTGSFDRNAPGAPIGSTYSVSEDGVARFKKTWTFFHPCRNPSVFCVPTGGLRMFANNHGKGTWDSASVDGDWRCVDADFPPGGDCTFFFHWGGYDYIIGGFTGLWSKRAEAPKSAYENQVAKGLDFYDGLNVPAISEISDGRFLMAGWTHIGGWGGNLVIRELVQLPGGRVGSKWMDEIIPAAEEPEMLAARAGEVATFPLDASSFLLTFNVHPAEAKKGRFGISFLPESGKEASCELQLGLGESRAQFGPGSLGDYAARQKSLREGGSPHRSSNYAIESLTGIDQPFPVRVIVKADEKLGGSLVDVEIAGRRTMISYRPELTVKKMSIRADTVAIENLRVAPLKMEK